MMQLPPEITEYINFTGSKDGLFYYCQLCWYTPSDLLVATVKLKK